MNPAARVLDMVDAPVDSLNQKKRRLQSEGRDIIDLGQAIPDFGPPPDALLGFSESLNDGALHRYTADSGLLELRAAVAASLGLKANGEPVSADEIIITAGANHAFMVACAGIINDGDAVGLLSPYFLNHVMTVQGIGGQPVELLPDESFVYDPSAVERAIEHNHLKALTIVNPSNPTGKLFSREEVVGLCNTCRKTGTWIISDEVYRRFDYSATGHVSVLSIPGTEENAIVIGSFSKEFGMTGWRVGWIRVPRKLVSHFLKSSGLLNYMLFSRGPALCPECDEDTTDLGRLAHCRIRLAQTGRVGPFRATTWVRDLQGTGSFFSMVPTQCGHQFRNSSVGDHESDRRMLDAGKFFRETVDQLVSNLIRHCANRSAAGGCRKGYLILRHLSRSFLTPSWTLQ
jgi:histidinol-phosphate/aromatic aminotransferase/cobyric acid decarboxylase-like protein